MKELWVLLNSAFCGFVFSQPTIQGNLLMLCGLYFSALTFTLVGLVIIKKREEVQ